MTANRFTNIVADVQKTPANQRADKLISGIAAQMQATDNPTTQQLGQELVNAKQQLVQACQQQA